MYSSTFIENFNIITDFAAVSDLIDFQGALTIEDNTTASWGSAAISSAGVATFNIAESTLALRLIATENRINEGSFATLDQVAIFQFGADAYVFISNGTDGAGAGDQLIKLVGVDTTSSFFDTITLSS